MVTPDDNSPEPPDDDSGSPEQSNPTSWKSTLWILWASQVASIFGFMFVLPFLALYLRDLGVEDDQTLSVWSGIVFGGSGVGAAIAAPFWGKLADRYGRRPMVLRATFSGAVIILAMGFISGPWQLLGLRLAQGVMTGTMPAAVAMITAVTPRTQIGYSLGVMQTAVFLGAALGPLAGGAAADAWGYRVPFYIAGGVLCLGALLVVFFTRERFAPPAITDSVGRRRGRIRDIVRQPGVPTMLLVFFILIMGGTIVAPIFPLFVEQLSAGAANVASLTGYLIAITNLFAAVFALVLGSLSDTMNRAKLLVWGTFASGLVFVGQSLVRNLVDLFILRGAAGITGGPIGPTINSLISDKVPQDGLGRAFGLTHAVSSLGLTLGPLLGGLLAAHLGYRWPFAITGFVMFGIAALAFWRVRDNRPSEETTAVPGEE